MASILVLESHSLVAASCGMDSLIFTLLYPDQLAGKHKQLNSLRKIIISNSSMAIP